MEPRFQLITKKKSHSQVFSRREILDLGWP